MELKTDVRVFPPTERISLVEDKTDIYDRYLFVYRSEKYIGHIIYYHELLVYSVLVVEDFKKMVSKIAVKILPAEKRQPCEYMSYDPFRWKDKCITIELQEYSKDIGW